MLLEFYCKLRAFPLTWPAAMQIYRAFSHDVTAAIFWCPNTMKRRPCCCPKPILWELNSFLMQMLRFVPMNSINAGNVSENVLYRMTRSLVNFKAESTRIRFDSNILIILSSSHTRAYMNTQPFLVTHIPLHLF